MIVTVTGGKGGVGKSTVSLNLGRELGAVVVDADMATADLPRGRGPDLHDVLAGRASPLEAVDQIGSVKLLPCGRTLEGARASDLTELERVVEMLDRQYTHVVVDSPAGLARDVGVQLASADVATLVTTPKKPALLNAFKTRKLALDLDTPVAALALNKARDGDDTLTTRIEDEMGVPTTFIPESDELAEAQEWGVPVRQVAADSRATTQLAALARTIEECNGRDGGAADSVRRVG